MARTKKPQWEQTFVDDLGECEIMYERHIDMHRYYVRKNGVAVVGDADYNIDEALIDALKKMKKKLHIPEPKPMQEDKRQFKPKRKFRQK